MLVSQVVTQRDAHLARARGQLSAAFRDAARPARPLLVVGGPRFDPAMAGDLGVDKIFGRGTTPREVASYLVHALASAREPAPVPADAPQLPRPPEVTGVQRSDPSRADASRTAGTCRTATRTTAATWWTAPTCSACSATWPPRCAIRTDGDEGLFAAYSDVQFRAPVLAGDVIEATATVIRAGRRSRELAFEARVVCRADPAAARPRRACWASRLSRLPPPAPSWCRRLTVPSPTARCRAGQP